MHVLIRADGGGEIGYGHLMRTSAIAEKFLEKEHTVTYATTTPKAAKEVCPHGVDIVVLPTRSDPDPFVEWIQANPTDTVLIDAYPANTEYQRMTRKYASLAVYTDDTRHSICADVLINGNLYAPELSYDFVGEQPKQLLGSEYVPLRKRIYSLTEREPRWREVPLHSLVTMGGSDVENRTPTVIRSFHGSDLHVDVIIGPGFSKSQEQAARKAAEGNDGQVSLIRNPDDIEERMYEADFAVTTAGSTTYELLALGTPIICQPIAKNQTLIAEALRDREAATIVDDSPGESSFRRAIEQYVSSKSLRRNRCDLGRDLVDGNGTKRIFDEILLMSE